MRVQRCEALGDRGFGFPFLFGGTFIEGGWCGRSVVAQEFPFLFGGTFIEGLLDSGTFLRQHGFPFLFGGTFIEGGRVTGWLGVGSAGDFPSFSEGLSLRGQVYILSHS